MTIKKFMWLDILILMVLAIIMDSVAYIITDWIRSSSLELPIVESVFIAPSFTIIYLIYHRWKKFGLIPNVIIIILHFILYGKQIFISYEYPLMIIASYMIFSLTLLSYKWLKVTKIPDWLFHLMNFMVIYILMFLVEYAIGVILGIQLSLLGITLRHTMNVILSSIIIIVMSVQKKLLIDMETHLIKQSKEEDYA
ncbi:Uncharacterised protein [Acholeplasma oculi]|uniref:Uncharacterized protein n=1 Tax=Acholeplasma oculi TaxID=35623 RepID=A0A061AI36_9MOLU|nr:hypothetical protein [Acholeplasma oculi]CDR31236.1 hypothetical protein Aocu_11630 [Acholeplasma oculi]SKC38276.1 hypothetical protein SAMN02745122_0595 [Acholeplasma oculi]SUT91297.1 Uncharacterised protein [Acholeplasma oculi]